MKPVLAIILAVVCETATVHAGPRSSANYTILADTTGQGGARSGSAAYSNDGSIGAVAGVVTATTPVNATARQGYLGQLYEVTALQVAAAPVTTVNEGATRQLSATPVLDDFTTLVVPMNRIVWSVLDGPLSGIDSNGLAMAAVVYQNTLAGVQGSYAGKTGVLDLTVLDSVADNFGTYAGDRLPDGWQVQHFGLSSLNGGPLGQFDGDGISNLLEFAFGTDPADGASGMGALAWDAGLITLRGQVTTQVQNLPESVDFRAVFARRKDYLAAGLVYQVQFSGDLLTWVTSAATPMVVASDAEMDAVSVPYPFFVGGKKARFFRVSVDFAP